MTVVVTVLVVVVAVLALLVAGLLRSHAVILRRLHDAGIDVYDPDTSLPLVGDAGDHDGTTPEPTAVPRGDAPARRGTALAPGTPAPNDATPGRAGRDVAGTSPDGDTLAYRMSGRREDTLLLFLSADCTTCQPFWEAVGDGRAATTTHRVLVVTRDPSAELVGALRERPTSVPVVMSSAAWHDYEVPGSPYFVHVDGASGRVRGEGTGGSWEQLADLVDRGRSETAVRGRWGRRRGGTRRPPRDSDEEVRAAGIEPGDPSLYPAPRDADQ